LTRQASYLCAEPRCPVILEHRGYCQEHRRAGQSSTPGYGRKWRRVRDRFIQAHPTCDLCDAPAADVHHRDHRSPTEGGANEWSNLQALCRSCHRRLTVAHAREDRGTTPIEQVGRVN
jgi:5-methylcytosine-specific restriction protein A